MMSEARGNKKRLKGTVVSDRMDKSIVVEVVTRKKHKRYNKFVNYKKKYMAHDEHNSAKVGDFVEIIESRPYSRRKRWRLIKVIESKGE